MWTVEMKGAQGYTCVVEIGDGNATNPAEACNIAQMMFPELKEPRCDADMVATSRQRAFDELLACAKGERMDGGIGADAVQVCMQMWSAFAKVQEA